MTVYWAGTENEAFDAGVLDYTTGGGFDSNFSRAALELGSTVVRCNKVNLPNLMTSWFHYRWGGASTGAETNTRTLVLFSQADGVGILRLQQTGTAPNKFFQYWDGAAWQNIGAALTITTGDGRQIDIKCVIDGAVGDFSLWVDGVLERSLTGDTDFFSSTGAAYVSIQGWGNSNQREVSECIIADQNTLSMRLCTLVPNGNGANTAWTGAFGDVDEAEINDADFISSGTAAQVETFTLTNLSAAALALTPVAVIGSFRARNAVTGPQNIDPAVRTGGANFFGSSVAGLNTSFTNGYQNVWGVNPDTGVAWTTTEIDALEAGVRSAT